MTVTAQAPFGLAGLTSHEAARRFEEGRANLVTWAPSRTFTQIVRDNAVTPVNIALFIICAILLGLGLFGDAVLTGGLVLGNIIVGVFQETRAKRQLDRIALLTRPQATVIRDGAEIEVPPEQVVEGDMLVLRPGDQAVVDGPIAVSKGLAVDESLLTGESEAVDKQPGEEIVSGSFCVAGTGVYEAARVGAGTLASRITAQARAHSTQRTPLQQEVNLVIWAMSLVVVFLGAEVARSFSTGEGDASFSEAVRAAAVIVALVPQGLVVMVTVSYAMGAVRMAGSGVLVQHMNALESLSRVDVLCVDKTGTITTNKLKLESLVPLEMPEPDLRALLGDFAMSAAYANRTLDGIRDGIEGAARPLRHEVPFQSSRGWSALVFDEADATGYVLGAPDVLLAQTPEPASIERQVEGWAKKGFRVLLFVAADAPHAQPLTLGEDAALPHALRPLGLIIMRDETRPDAAEAVGELTDTGIELKIISGDHPETVMALATQAGIAFEGDAVAGPDLRALDEQQLAAAAGNASIFGRVSPDTKESLVKALQRSGRYVAMIGDGVNDVPAMKTAQVAVGLRSGAGITRSIADVVLLRDEFSRLPAAFREGQRIRKGMEGIFSLFLTRTLSLTLVLLFVSLLDDPFPVSPRHTALIALMTVGIPTLGLAAWAQPARTGERLILSGARFVVPAALSIAAVALLMYEFYWSTTDDVDQARTALTITSVLCGLILILFLVPPSPAWTGANPLSSDRRPAMLTAALFVAFIVVLANDTLRTFYELELPDVWGFMVIIIVVALWAVGLRAFWRAQIRARIAELETRVRSRLRRTG